MFQAFCGGKTILWTHVEPTVNTAVCRSVNLKTMLWTDGKREPAGTSFMRLEY